jgi:outer membrane receptor protein involved in Fe transport
MFLGYAFTDAKYDEWDTRYFPSPGVTRTVDISDSEFANVPRNQWNAAVNYTVPFANGQLMLSANATGQSSVATFEINTANCGSDGLYTPCLNRQFRLDGYSLINLRAEWQNVGSLGFDVAVFMNNAADKYYENYSLSLLGTLGTAASGIGAPRTWGVELRVPIGSSRR